MTFARKNTSRAKAALPKQERRMRAARMWGHALSLKMIRRNFWLVVLATILFLGVWMIYMTMTTSKDGHPVNRRYGSWIELGKALALNNIPDTDRKVEFYRPAEQHEPHGNHTWEHSVPWKAEFMGRVNLHVFEDWCGSSIKQLRRNLHFPLYPHSRTTISKLAVTPQWTNYALRIFGYLHPAADDDYQFGISSDDNSEFWLSEDETVGKLQLLCRVGPPGNQWTAPGEFEKFQSQRSQFIRLSASRRYYFELLHKQDDAGTDHVELAWRLAALGSPFTLIDSQFLSLYSDESQLPLGDTSYTPQTSASHPSLCTDSHPADMLKPDPRDDIYKVPLLSMKRLHKVLPSCPYKPSYLVSGYPLQRYQGLHFVRLTYVYPNDFTRLSHMEKENNCMYQVQLRHSDRHIYNRYMEMEALDNQGGDDVYNPSDFQYEDMQNGAKEAGDYAYNVPGKHRKLLGELPVKVVESGAKEVPDHRKVISSETPRNWTERPPNSLQKGQKPHGMSSDATVKPPSEGKVPGSRSTSIPRQRVDRAGEKQQRNIRKEGTGSILEGRGLGLGTDHRSSIRDRMRLSEVGKKQDLDNEIHKTGKETVGPPSTVATRATMNKELRQRPKRKVKQMSQQGEAVNQVSKPVSGMGEEMQKRSRQEDGGDEKRRGQPILEAFSQRQGIRQSEGERQTFENLEGRRQAGRQGEDVKQGLGKDGGEDFGRDREVQQRKPDERRGQEPAQITDTNYNRLSVMEPEKEVNVELYKHDEESPEYEEEDEEEEEMDYPFIFEQPVGWNRTFNAGQTDFQIVRSDSIDLQCNTSGNLLLREREALSITRAFMKKLNQNYRGVYQLWRIVNVEKRVDYVRGSRYFLELELKGRSDRILRLSQYVFAPGWNGLSPEDRDDEREMRNMMLGSRRRLMGAEEQMELCWPLGLIWNPHATVYFIVPVKNQARWVQKFIWDMEVLYKTTSDAKFSVIIVDFSSTDLDVTSALKQSRIPSYEIITLQGNFERSAGLQAGINVVKNPHSILFLCDLHMHFPPSSIDLVRTHTVEGKMVFAPIVMRLNCGASPCWPDGYWEVNGFGLLGIYKSDLDRIGGMNTAEFRDRWGGEDWELLDRILQAGLEVERLYVRNFFHHFHSKRGMWNRRQAPGGQ